MPGLLNKGGFDDPLTMGLLGASQALMTPMSQGGGMGAAFNAFPAAQQQAMRQQFLRQQMEGQQSEAELRRAQLMAAQEEARRKIELDSRREDLFGRIGMQPLTQALAAEAAALGIKPAELADIANAGRAKVARTLEVMGPGNMPQTRREDEYGNQIGADVGKPFEMKLADLGGSLSPYNPFAPPSSLTKTMTPGDLQQARDAAAGRGVTIRGQNISEQARQAEASRPIWSPEQGAFVYRPTAAAPTGTFVQPVGPGGAPLPTKPADLAKIEADIRKELNDLPQVKKFANATPAYKAIVDASGRDNKQADINLVYGLAKLYDPDSVVREGEYDTIAKSQTIPEWLKGQAAALAGTGGKLTPATRAMILKEAEGRFNSYRSEYNAATTVYSQIAKERGANPKNVVVPIAGDIPNVGNWSIKKVP